ncbi:MAG: ROK family protein [Gemmatimonadetes bacterium]|nr:ROK family protein [Gemmatimonadota bacterium]
MADLVWGIDLGGTKIEGVVLPSRDSAEPLCRLRVPTGAEGGYVQVRRRICGLVEDMKAEVGEAPRAIGIGTPGVLDPETGLIKNSNTTCLIGEPLRADLETELGVEIAMANDANCFALAEAALGAGRGAETVFGIIMGTGVGGGVVVDGRVLYGCQGIAGEWGHNLLDPAGPDCYCGRRGCVETFLSGPHLERFYAQGAGRRRSLAEIVDLHRLGSDPHATATVERLLDYFGRALAVVVNLLDPHVVVLGGGVSNVGLLYSEGPGRLARWMFNDRCETRIARNQLGDSAGVFGAAMLVA